MTDTERLDFIERVLAEDHAREAHINKNHKGFAMVADRDNFLLVKRHSTFRAAIDSAHRRYKKFLINQIANKLSD